MENIQRGEMLRDLMEVYEYDKFYLKWEECGCDFGEDESIVIQFWG